MLADVFGDTCISTVGLIQTFTMLNLAYSLQIIYHRRENLPKTFVYFGVVILIIIAVEIAVFIRMGMQALFFVDAAVFALTSTSLYMTLSFLLTVMQSTATPNLLAMSEERQKLALVVSVFGISFILGFGLIFVKAMFWDQYVLFLQTNPAVYYLGSLFSSVLIDILPIFLIYTLHS